MFNLGDSMESMGSLKSIIRGILGDSFKILRKRRGTTRFALGISTIFFTRMRKYEGDNRSSSQFSWGRQALDSSGLLDLGFEGYPFMWSDGRSRKVNIQCRLERALSTSSFISKLSPIKIIHLPRYYSDLVIIRIDQDCIHESSSRTLRHLFRFEEVLTRDVRCEGMVRHCWNSSRSGGVNKLKAIQSLGEGGLKWWNREIFGWLDLKVDSRVSDLSDLDGVLHDYVDISCKEEVEKRSHVLKDIWKNLNIKESLLYQKSRQRWNKEGYQNNKFLYNAMKARFTKNYIASLETNVCSVEQVNEVKVEIRK
ncbi:hypothetical protein KIW84_053594 [Lathyrus oleraceus]|uniref:Reverse transcriptase n=1 Tax=Pisum sativum TaxID=3888 RepID=A0A9D4WT30_PEA|nr:hypothetical protein KIW84_053594 [Pisum sativum]